VVISKPLASCGLVVYRRLAEFVSLYRLGLFFGGKIFFPSFHPVLYIMAASISGTWVVGREKSPRSVGVAPLPSGAVASRTPSFASRSFATSAVGVLGLPCHPQPSFVPRQSQSPDPMEVEEGEQESQSGLREELVVQPPPVVDRHSSFPLQQSPQQPQQLSQRVVPVEVRREKDRRDRHREEHREDRDRRHRHRDSHRDRK
jgi:hypothetical protein